MIAMRVCLCMGDPPETADQSSSDHNTQRDRQYIHAVPLAGRTTGRGHTSRDIFSSLRLERISNSGFYQHRNGATGDFGRRWQLFQNLQALTLFAVCKTSYRLKRPAGDVEDAAMGSKCQKPIHSLHQLEVDNEELVRRLAELATLRERVRHLEAAIYATSVLRKADD
jgi:hypothetical protein